MKIRAASKGNRDASLSFSLPPMLPPKGARFTANSPTPYIYLCSTPDYRTSSMKPPTFSSLNPKFGTTTPRSSIVCCIRYESLSTYLSSSYYTSKEADHRSKDANFLGRTISLKKANQDILAPRSPQIKWKIFPLRNG